MVWETQCVVGVWWPIRTCRYVLYSSVKYVWPVTRTGTQTQEMLRSLEQKSENESYWMTPENMH
jgi:hypothetical protein